MDVHRVLFVQHPAERMFDLVEAAEYYPSFLPWCARTSVLERSDEVVVATLWVDWHGVRIELTTRNLKRRPEWMEVALERGPFRHFRGEWLLKPLGSDGCRVDFRLRYEFSAAVVERIASPVFERIANTLVDAFVRRADQLGPAIPRPPFVVPAAAGRATSLDGAQR